MKTIKGDLILKKDTTFDESIIVDGNIKGEYNLKVNGNIDCLDIDCLDIDCLDIDCWNIHCLDIDCWNIHCLDIDCLDIDCWDIDCLDINCRNINCRNINCRNINCRNINCRNINCRNIILCNKFKAKGDIKAKAIIKNRFDLKQKEFDGNGDEK